MTGVGGRRFSGRPALRPQPRDTLIASAYESTSAPLDEDRDVVFLSPNFFCSRVGRAGVHRRRSRLPSVEQRGSCGHET